MPNLEQLKNQKERILSAIKIRGPSLPVQIARMLNVSIMFASAFLSELKSENKLKISNMRVGSSPLYYLESQEGMLENFVIHLNQREREAFEHLKKNLILEDEKQTPVMRVALRAIKDFAVSVRVRIDGESKIFWKHHLLDDGEIGKIISGRLKGIRKDETLEKDITEDVSLNVKSLPDLKTQEKIVSEDKKEFVEPKPEIQKELVEKNTGRKKVKKVQESEFSVKLKDYLSKKKIELLENFVEKKKEFEGRIRIDSFFGKQEFYLVAKDKKSATENDLSIAWQKAQGMKIPALVLSTGELNKKGKEHLKDWGNLVKYEKIKIS